MPTTVTRGLIRYEGGAQQQEARSPYGDGWQEQVDMAASVLAAAALAGGMPKVAGTLSERQLARYLRDQATRRRRTAMAKLSVIVGGLALSLVAGCYIGLLG